MPNGCLICSFCREDVVTSELFVYQMAWLVKVCISNVCSLQTQNHVYCDWWDGSIFLYDSIALGFLW